MKNDIPEYRNIVTKVAMLTEKLVTEAFPEFKGEIRDVMWHRNSAATMGHGDCRVTSSLQFNWSGANLDLLEALGEYGKLQVDGGDVPNHLTCLLFLPNVDEV